MRYDVSEILGRVGSHRVISVDEPAITDDVIECAGPICGSIVFNNTGSALLVTGEISTVLELACGRCLVPFAESVCVAVDEQFPLVVSAAGARTRFSGVVVEEDADAATGRLFEGHLFDVTELLRQVLTVSMPLQPLHREDCAGLCGVCGHDLNAGSCGCQHGAPAEALSPFLSLLDRTSSL